MSYGFHATTALCTSDARTITAVSLPIVDGGISCSVRMTP